MPELTRQVSWGDALVVEQFKYPGGLKAAVEVIRDEVGAHIGVRGTFQKFLKVSDPDTLADRDRFRVWLLIAAFGQDPKEWGIADDVVPGAFSARSLRRRFVAHREYLEAVEREARMQQIREQAEKGQASLAERPEDDPLRVIGGADTPGYIPERFILAGGRGCYAA